MPDPAIPARDQLAHLLAPVSVEDFLADYWQKKPLVLSRNQPGYYDGLLTLADLDALISNVALPVTQVDMGQSAVGVPKASIDRGGYIDPEKVLSLHRAGNTIIMRAMELWLPRLKALCLGAGAFFNADAQTNIYVTPSSTHSSYPHWDSHDLFIIQIKGRKTWDVHAADMDAPLPSYRFNPDRHAVGQKVSEFVLNAGDIAYLPRGLPHNPMADDYSVHVSLGVLVKTWADLLLRSVSDSILRDRRLREALPMDFAGGRFDIQGIRAKCAEVFDLALRPAAVDAVIAEISADLLAERPGATAGQLSQMAAASGISLDSIIEAPAGGPGPVRRPDGAIGAVLNGVELSVDAGFATAIDFVSGGGPVRVADIPAASDAHRIAFAQKLAQEGCLTLVDGDAGA